MHDRYRPYTRTLLGLETLIFLILALPLLLHRRRSIFSSCRGPRQPHNHHPSYICGRFIPMVPSVHLLCDSHQKCMFWSFVYGLSRFFPSPFSSPAMGINDVLCFSKCILFWCDMATALVLVLDLGFWNVFYFKM